MQEKSSTQETETIADGDKRSLILLHPFPNKAETSKWKSSGQMLGCRREVDRNKGGLGGLACAGGDYLELCSACQVLSRMGYFRAFWGPAVGTTLVRGVFPHKLVDIAWTSFKLVLKIQTQELLRKPSEGGEGLNAAYVKCAGWGGESEPWWAAALTWVMGQIEVGNRMWSLSSPPSHTVDNSHLR